MLHSAINAFAYGNVWVQSTHNFHLSFVNSFLICVHRFAAFCHQYCMWCVTAFLWKVLGALWGASGLQPVSSQKEMDGWNICKCANSATHYDLDDSKLYNVNNFKTVLKESPDPNWLLKTRWLVWWLGLAGFCHPAELKLCLFPTGHLRPELTDCKSSFPEHRANELTTAITFWNKKLSGVPAEKKSPPILS